MKNQFLRVYLSTGLCILAWAGSASAFKLALRTIAPAPLLLFSSAISLLVISGIITLRKKWGILRALKIKTILGLLMLGLLNPFFYYLILFQAYSLLPGQVAMSLNYLWPVVLALLSVPVLKQKLSFVQLSAILISFAGAVIIAGQGRLNIPEHLSVTGIFLALTSTVIWALYWLINARIAVDAGIKLLAGFAGGIFSILMYVFFTEPINVSVITAQWPVVLYVGVFEMGLTFFLWLNALQYAQNAAQVGNWIYLTPFVSLLFLHLTVGERIDYTTPLGLIVIILGILVQQVGMYKKNINIHKK